MLISFEQIGRSKQCRPRSDCFSRRVWSGFTVVAILSHFSILRPICSNFSVITVFISCVQICWTFTVNAAFLFLCSLSSFIQKTCDNLLSKLGLWNCIYMYTLIKELDIVELMIWFEAWFSTLVYALCETVFLTMRLISIKMCVRQMFKVCIW